MGSREGRAGDAPRQVRVQGFWLGAREVTAGEYLGYLRSHTPDGDREMSQFNLRHGFPRLRSGERSRPVVFVSQDDARGYCRWLSEKLGKKVRLPTEAEWEYAARGGLHQARYPWGWGGPEGRACFAGRRSRPAGLYPPNAYGLYDMAGNVYEWCLPDEIHGTENVNYARGGSWAEKDPKMLTVFSRASFPPGYRDADVGFRILVEAD